jgi:hypothetical protein
MVSSFQVFQPKYCTHFSSPPCVLHVPPSLRPLVKHRDSFNLIIFIVIVIFMYIISFLRERESRGTMHTVFKTQSSILTTSGNFSFHHCVQNGSGANPASYPMDIRGSFSGGKVCRGVTLTTQLHLVPRSKSEWRYTSTPPIRLHGLVLS